MDSMKNVILIVDDSEMNRSVLSDILSEEYEILEASDGVEAVALLEQDHGQIALVLLDIVMPEMDGFEVLSIMNRNGWLEHTPVITISSESSSTYIDRAYDLGAMDFISRPFDERMVQRRVKNAFMLYAKQKTLERTVKEQILEKEQNGFLMVDILSNIVEFRNGESGLHVLHIRVMTDILLQELMGRTSRYGLTPSKISMIVNAAAMHDVGKIAIPEQILNKPGKLTKEEFECMKQHTVMGAKILEKTPRQVGLVRIAREICRWHHERFDGQGYPDGLKGEEIPISAQVVSIADVYDALTSERVYKPPYTHEQAMDMIRSGQCGVFNPLLLQCLEDAGERIREAMQIHSDGEVSKMEIRSIVSELISSHTLQASSRSLSLLEQERIKYRFFASMSQEVQFEFSARTDLLKVSEWGAKYLGLQELIAHPSKNAVILSLFEAGQYQRFLAQIRQTTPVHPEVSGNYCLRVRGEQRWFKVVARTIWDDEDDRHYSEIIGKFIDIHEEQVELNNLKQLAALDPLTALANRRSAVEQITAAIEGRTDHRFALLLLDMDSFKSANDQHGHVFGDAVLKEVAARIRRNIRGDDIAARVGGDEFLIFMKYQADITAVAKRIFGALHGTYQGFSIAISMGVSLCPDHGTTYEELFHRADQALYAAKQDGRDQFCVYDEALKNYLSAISS